jgi:hypothetical protein
VLSIVTRNWNRTNHIFLLRGKDPSGALLVEIWRQKISEPLITGDGGTVKFCLPPIGLVLAIPFALQIVLKSRHELSFKSETIEPPDEVRIFTIYDIVERLTVDFNFALRLYDFDGYGTYLLNSLHGTTSHVKLKRVMEHTTIELGMVVPLTTSFAPVAVCGVNAQIQDSKIEMSLRLRRLKNLFHNRDVEWISGFAECWSEFIEITNDMLQQKRRIGL